MPSVKPDHTGMLDKTKAKPGQLDNLFEQNDVKKYNQCHGPGGKFCSGGGGGGGGSVTVGPSGAVYQTPAPKVEEPKGNPGNLTPEEFSALKAYGREDYAVLNSRLRHEPYDKMPEKYQEMTKNMDSAFTKQTPLASDTKVFRGVNYGNAFGSAKPDSLVGKVIEDKGFMSTTTSVDVAGTFGSTRLNIVVPKGTKVVNMAQTLQSVAAKQERELLLPRGTKLQITHVAQTKGGFLGIGKETFIEAKVV